MCTSLFTISFEPNFFSDFFVPPVPVPTGGVSLQPCTVRGSMETKKNIFEISSDTPPVGIVRVAAVGYRHIGCSAMSQHAFEFFVTHSQIKKDSTFILGPNRCYRFFEY
jgi:hypothetical protein